MCCAQEERSSFAQICFGHLDGSEIDIPSSQDTLERVWLLVIINKISFELAFARAHHHILFEHDRGSTFTLVPECEDRRVRHETTRSISSAALLSTAMEFQWGPAVRRRVGRTSCPWFRELLDQGEPGGARTEVEARTSWPRMGPRARKIKELAVIRLMELRA